MRKLAYILFFFCLLSASAQAVDVTKNTVHYFTPEIHYGVTLPSNKSFPDRKMQKSLQLNWNTQNLDLSKKWVHLLNYPATGVNLSYTDFGNPEEIGKAYAIAPFIEYNFKKDYLSNVFLKACLGVSYVNRQYDPVTNVNNMATSTPVNAYFNLSMKYKTQLFEQWPITLGGGYVHYSNGHSKLPNKGINSAVFSLAYDFHFIKNDLRKPEQRLAIARSYQTYFDFKNGMGSQDFLHYKPEKNYVVSHAFQGGIVIKDTYKLGLGVGYRFYRHYYDYIVENDLVEYMDHPRWKASNIFVFISTEALLNHVGLNIDGGLNIHKPFYKKHFELQYLPLNFKYELKKLFVGRMGLKLYANNTSKLPQNNLYLGAHINANLSQADFIEFSVGITHRLYDRRFKK